jgi:hypothetical protein
LHAYQTTPARYAIGIFRITIRKMNPHHSPDTAESVVRGARRLPGAADRGRVNT